MVESSDFFCDGWLRSNRRCRQMLTNQCDKMYEKNTNLLPTCQLQPLNDGSLVSFISSNLRDSNFFISIYQSYCGLICHVFHQGLLLVSDELHFIAKPRIRHCCCRKKLCNPKCQTYHPHSREFHSRLSAFPLDCLVGLLLVGRPLVSFQPTTVETERASHLIFSVWFSDFRPDFTCPVTLFLGVLLSWKKNLWLPL